MRGVAADDLLRLPVRMHGIKLGHPVDVILDVPGRRVLGLEVRCGDEGHRFLPLSTARIHPDEIAVGSALMLLGAPQLEYYRNKGSVLRTLRGRVVERPGAPAGRLKDVVVGTAGEIEALLVEHDGAVTRLRPEDILAIAA